VVGSAASKTVEEFEKIRHQAHKHMQAREWHEALTAFNKLLLDDQEDVDALLGAALALDRLGDYTKFYLFAQSVAQIDPISSLSLSCKARSLQNLYRIS